MPGQYLGGEKKTSNTSRDDLVSLSFHRRIPQAYAIGTRLSADIY